MRCGCPVDTSAKQKHRPSRQARYVNGCGNPFSFLRVLRILSRYALGMTYRLAIATIVECAASRHLVIAKVRVSGGHLCKAEAPTEPAGEICKRLWQSVFLFKDITDSFALTTLAGPKAVIRLEREQLLTAASAVARFFQHCSESNVTRNDKKLTGYAMNVKS